MMDEDWKNDNQRNVLFGKALEKAVAATLGNKENRKLKQIFIENSKTYNNLPIMYFVKAEFTLKSSNQDRLFPKMAMLFEEELFHGKIFSKIKIPSINLKVCKNYECKDFGQTKFMKGKDTKTCLLCGKELDLYRTKLIKEEEIFSGNLEEAINYLKEYKYIIPTNKLIEKQVDNIIFLQDGEVVVIEAKNKTYTSVNTTDVKTSLVYPLIIKKYGPMINFTCKKLTIVKKGEVNFEMADYFPKLKSYYNMDFDIVDYVEWCRIHKTDKGYLSKVSCKWNGKKYDWMYEWSDIFIGTELSIKSENLNPNVMDYKSSGKHINKDDRALLTDILTTDLKKSENINK